jgi:hypothetical protein
MRLSATSPRRAAPWSGNPTKSQRTGRACGRGNGLAPEFEQAGWERLREAIYEGRSARELIHSARVVGPRVHDARVAATCTAHGISELWSADRDFSRFSALCTKNPLTA